MSFISVFCACSLALSWNHSPAGYLQLKEKLPEQLTTSLLPFLFSLSCCHHTHLARVLLAFLKWERLKLTHRRGEVGRDGERAPVGLSPLVPVVSKCTCNSSPPTVCQSTLAWSEPIKSLLIHKFTHSFSFEHTLARFWSLSTKTP